MVKGWHGQTGYGGYLSHYPFIFVYSKDLQRDAWDKVDNVANVANVNNVDNLHLTIIPDSYGGKDGQNMLRERWDRGDKVDCMDKMDNLYLTLLSHVIKYECLTQ